VEISSKRVNGLKKEEEGERNKLRRRRRKTGNANEHQAPNTSNHIYI
jgi:hypothetical protein